ncbi:hypothetical protein EAI_02514 [Harpegnathos saltator]|uniref:Uncharacterized protein n=2 Tax=Harpegnathos saltator TaxID=610380 RepID=E2B7K3_HARSA|nr:hypothetical protein EAI_02514 [Harpegnathos saltator]
MDIKNNVSIKKIVDGRSDTSASEDSAIFSQEDPVKIKVEDPEPEAYTWDNTADASNYSQLNNDGTNVYDNINLNGCTESRKRKKREHIEIDASFEPERKKKKKKHVKRPRESDSESTCVAENEKEIINNITSTVKRIKYKEEIEEEQDNKKHKKHKKKSLVMSDSEPDFPVKIYKKEKEEQNNKKHKKNKKVSMVMSDSEPDFPVKVKEEKPDPVIDKIIKESSRNYESSGYENMGTQNLDEHMETDICTKTESSDKEKKKRSKKASKDIDSEVEFKIKSENKIVDDTFEMNKHDSEDAVDEQHKHMNHNILESDISSSISDNEHISKKQKKSKKSSKEPLDSKLKHHVKIKEEEDN